MNDVLRIILAQKKFLVGDIDGNAERIIDTALTAANVQRADLVVFPELALTGYPPEDLLLRPRFVNNIDSALEKIVTAIGDVRVLFGAPLYEDGKLYNCAVFIKSGAVDAVYRKQELPNYGVFDEKRYFESGNESCVLNIEGVSIGITICEDIWIPGPAQRVVNEGAKLLINLNASPYHLRKFSEREQLLRERVNETGLSIIYLNLIGGQDELVFDGNTMVMDEDGNIVCRAESFHEDLNIVEVSKDTHRIISKGPLADLPNDEESIYKALILGIQDYAYNNGFDGAVIGLSGGIDSAMTLAIAVDALGADKVEAVMMPSRYTAKMSLEDSRAEAQNLGVQYRTISIEPMYKAFVQSLSKEFKGLKQDTAEENIQARCRGTLLMAISNKTHKIVLSTGNKSEMAVGYATLYGDLAGGFAPLKDVSKTWVYRLAEYRNRIGPVIPQRVIERPPSAELAPNQVDEDSLPPYEVLDPILEMFIEGDRSVDDIVAAGYERDVVQQVVSMVLSNEYKRRQAPPGIRITRKAFGKDRRYPITSGFAKRQN